MHPIHVQRHPAIAAEGGRQLAPDVAQPRGRRSVRRRGTGCGPATFPVSLREGAAAKLPHPGGPQGRRRRPLLLVSSRQPVGRLSAPCEPRVPPRQACQYGQLQQNIMLTPTWLSMTLPACRLQEPAAFDDDALVTRLSQQLAGEERSAIHCSLLGHTCRQRGCDSCRWGNNTEYCTYPYVPLFIIRCCSCACSRVQQRPGKAARACAAACSTAAATHCAAARASVSASAVGSAFCGGGGSEPQLW